MEVMEKGRVTHSPLFIMRALSVQVPPDSPSLSRACGRFAGHIPRLATAKKNPVIGVRIAAVAPKKVANTAVLRNGIKRHIYEAVRPLIASITTSAGQGIHIIIFAKAEAVKADFKAIVADLKALFVKARISV